MRIILCNILILIGFASSSVWAQGAKKQAFQAPTCVGVCSGLTSEACVSLSPDQTQLMCNSTDKEMTQISSLGWVIEKIPAGSCKVIYDCNKVQDRTNEKRTMEKFTFQPFRIDPDLMVNNPHKPTPAVKDPAGVIALKAISVTRNWETDDVDEGGSEATFDVMGLWILPEEYLAEQLKANDLEFDVWGNLFNNQLIYDPDYESQREALSDLLRNKLPKTKYTANKIMGPYLNVKSGIHKWMDEWKGNEPKECEWVGCDIIGPQILVYDKTYGISKWSHFEKMKDDDGLIVIAKGGDGMALKDDILLYFKVTVGMFREGKRILYTQKNPKDGTDMIIVLELVKNPN